MTTYRFTDRAGKPGSFEAAAIGPEWGPILTGDTVMDLFKEHGDDLPFPIMSAGYGHDNDEEGDEDDWTGLDASDIDPDEDDGPSLDADWGPFQAHGTWEWTPHEGMILKEGGR